jgi:hypothetical protein
VTAEHLRDDGDRGEAHGRLFWSAFVIGWALIGFGVWTVFAKAGAIHPLSFGSWFVGLALLHDLLLAPLLSAVAVVLVPRVPTRARGAVLTAAIVSGALVIVSLPALLGDPAGNETILPRNYAAGLAVAIATTWTLAAIWMALGRARARRSR